MYHACLGGGLNGQSGHPAPQHPLRITEVFSNNGDTFFFMGNDV